MRKFLPYILILIVVMGFFSLAGRVQAAPPGQCWNKLGEPLSTGIWSYEQCIARTADLGTTWGMSPPSIPTSSTEKCWDKNGAPLPHHESKAVCEGSGNTWGTSPPAMPVSSASDEYKPEEQDALDAFTDKMCGVNPLSQGCILRIFYLLFNGVASMLLALSANFFNTLVAISLSSKLTAASNFIPEAWKVVRDLSNIFFILALLYIAFQTILGLGGHSGPKKMIAQVIIMALLINFSMFFTKIVIDSANILALVFYNKLDTETMVIIDGVKQPRAYTPSSKSTETGLRERDISGGMVQSFNPTRLLSPEFFEKAKTTEVLGKRVVDEVPFGIIISIILISGMIMLFAAYTFFIAGFAFLGRLIELWVLIIFAPFAFMSSVLPVLEKVQHIGWKDWLHRLISTSFMAPIFMFFMYLIFKLVNANIFDSFVKEESGQGIMASILSVLIPAMILLAMLLKATEYAKKGGGQFGDAIFKGANMLGGLAIGGAALGTAVIGRKTVGAFMKGASTEDSANQRYARGAPMRGRWDTFKGWAGHTLTGGALTTAQQAVGGRLREDQLHIEQAKHARHELDTAAESIAPGKKWEELNGEQRYQARRKLARERVVRENAGDVATAGPAVVGTYRFGNRKWDALSPTEQAEVDRSAGVGNDPVTGHAIAGGALETNTTWDDTHTIPHAYRKQGLISNVVQSTVTGGYDVRKLADVIMKEQSTGFAKIAMGLTGALAMGMRGGFKQMGINYGTAQGNFFKDLGNTISESLKNAKINVDLSKVGEEKKESDKGGGHH